MVWNAPATWTTGQVLTAANLNAQLRDNLLQTVPAKLTTVGQYAVATGTNTVGARIAERNTVSVTAATTGTSYGDLSTSGGPFITFASGTQAIVGWAAYVTIDTTNATAFMSMEIGGASAQPPTDNTSIAIQTSSGTAAIRGSHVKLVVGLTPSSSNTCFGKYRVSSGTGTFSDRAMWVLPF